jgi:hypothetical protein
VSHKCNAESLLHSKSDTRVWARTTRWTVALFIQIWSCEFGKGDHEFCFCYVVLGIPVIPPVGSVDRLLIEYGSTTQIRTKRINLGVIKI